MTRKDVLSVPLGAKSSFESIRHVNEYDMEYWMARELLKELKYNEYQFFRPVIDRAIESC